MTIRITDTITSIDTFIVMIRKHIITTEDTPKEIGTNPEIIHIGTEKKENLQNAMGTRISNLFIFSQTVIQEPLLIPSHTNKINTWEKI